MSDKPRREFASSDGCFDFVLAWSDKRKRWTVYVGESWDYESQEEAREMSAEIRGCKSFDDACEELGLNW